MHLPQELIDCIIAFLRHSHPTLVACSLVSSSWTDTAHRYLFYRLEYVRENQGTQADYPSLLRFLEATPSVTKHVRKLDLRGRNGKQDGLDSQTFAGLVATLPRLEDIVLMRLKLLPSPSPTIDPLGPSKVPAVIPKPPRSLCLHTLCIEATRSSSVLSVLCQYLRPILSAQTLLFWDIHPRVLASVCISASDVKVAYKNLHSPTNLDVETLVFDTSSRTVLLPLEIIRRASPRSLRNLEFSYGHIPLPAAASDISKMAGIVQGFLEDVGAGLESISINVEPLSPGPNLSQCTSLRTLTFKHCLKYCVRKMWKHPFTLGALTSTPKIPFKLVFSFREEASLVYESWSTWLQVLSRMELGSLEKAIAMHPCSSNPVTFLCKGLGDFLAFEDVEKFIREKLPDLDSNGLLNIVRCVA